MPRSAEKERMKQIAHMRGYHPYEEDETTPWPTEKKLSEEETQEANDKKDDKKKADKKKDDDKKSDDEEDDEEDDSDDKGDDEEDNGEGEDKDKKKKAAPFPPKKKNDKKKTEAAVTERVNLRSVPHDFKGPPGSVFMDVIFLQNSQDFEGFHSRGGFGSGEDGFWEASDEERFDYLMQWDQGGGGPERPGDDPGWGSRDDVLRDGPFFMSTNSGLGYAGLAVLVDEDSGRPIQDSAPTGDKPLQEETITEQPVDYKKRTADLKKEAQAAIKKGNDALEAGASTYEEVTATQHRDNRGEYVEYDVKLRSINVPDWVNELTDDPHGEWAWEVIMLTAGFWLEDFTEDLKSHYKIALTGDGKIYQTGRSGGWLMVPYSPGDLSGTLDELEAEIDELQNRDLRDLEAMNPDSYEDGVDDPDFQQDYRYHATAVQEGINNIDDYVLDVENYIKDFATIEKAVKELIDGSQKEWSSEEFWVGEIVNNKYPGIELAQAILSAVEDERLKLNDLPEALRKEAAKSGFTL